MLWAAKPIDALTMRFRIAPYEFVTPPGDSLEGMSLNPADLTFVGGNSYLESGFREAYSLSSLQHGRIATCVGAAMIATYGIIDAFVLEESLDVVLAVRFGLLIPILIFFYSFTFSPRFLKQDQITITIMVTSIGIGVATIVLLVPENVSQLYFPGNMLVIMFAFLFLNLRFFWANLAGWSMTIGYSFMDFAFTNIAIGDQFVRLTFCATTCFLGMFVAYSTEFYARRNYFLLNVLGENKRSLELNSAELERRVLERTDQARAATKAKADFLANMSHEIRTPMNGVLGMLDLLRDSDLTDDQREKIGTAFNSAEGLLDVINDVLDLSKIEAGKMKLSQRPLAPALVIEDVASLLSPQFRDKELPLVCELSPEAYDFYLLDRTRLRQIILNLLGNALKFTDRGMVKISCSAKAGILTIEIKDTGIGILEEQRKNLFGVFSQVDNSSSREFGGTGLGLSISKQLTELMQGSISVESRFSEGSVFTLNFPVEACPNSNSSIENTSIFKKVFFVVESEYYSRSIRLMLKRLGCTITRLDEAEIAITDMSSIDCGGLPVLFLRGGDTESGDEQETSIGPRTLKLPFTLAALASQLNNGVQGIKEDSPKPPVKTFTGHRVLLVEDNVINQKVASSMMKKLGVVADTAMSGKEALDKFTADKYDLIFMDCQMPGMDGFETTQAIRKRENEGNMKNTVVVALTANAMEGDRKRCLDAGMDDYMSKPISLAGLEQVFDRWNF